jgi:hypothetical protein
MVVCGFQDVATILAALPRPSRGRQPLTLDSPIRITPMPRMAPQSNELQPLRTNALIAASGLSCATGDSMARNSKDW